MIQSYLKRTFFIALILISIQNSNQIIESTVKEIISENYTCSTNLKYDFDIIINSFNDSVTLSDIISFHVQTSDGRKLDTSCNPYQFLYSKFMCHINVRYLLDKSDIFLPIQAPSVKKYSFKNWEQVIGANPGVSNKIGNVTCLPEEQNTFIPSSVTIENCYYNYRSFTINGEWEKKDKVDLSNRLSGKILLDNKNGDIASCRYQASYNGFECSFSGEGVINMKEQYFTTLYGVYKMKEFNSGKYSNQCDDDDDDNDVDFDIPISTSAENLHFLNKILIFMIFLLF